MPEFEGETAEVLEGLAAIAKTHPQFEKICDKAQNLIVDLARENSRLLNAEDETCAYQEGVTEFYAHEPKGAHQ